MTAAEELAQRFAAANAEAIDYVLGPAAAHWQEPTEAEGWPVGVTARHIGLGHELMTGWARCIRERQPVVVDDIHAHNADVAAQGVVASPEEVAELLRSGGTAVAAALGQLSDADLEGEVDFSGRQMPARMLAEAAINHVTTHLGSIRATVERAESAR